MFIAICLLDKVDFKNPRLRRRPEKKKNKQKSLKEVPGTRAFRMKCCQESFNAYKMTISIIPG